MTARQFSAHLFQIAVVALVTASACAPARDAGANASTNASTSASTNATSNAPAAADTLHFPAPDHAISLIVAPRWTDEDVRDRFGEAARVIALAGVHEGMTVVDIGAGDGYYAVRLSKVVGATGKVIGEDIMPDYVELLRARVKYESLQNVDAVLGKPDNPMLAPQSIDAAFMIHMYHEITRPYELLWNLSVAMKPAATLAIVDQDGTMERHGTPPALLQCELGILGYEQTQTATLKDGAYVALFRAPSAPVVPDSVRRALAGGTCDRVKQR